MTVLLQYWSIPFLKLDCELPEDKVMPLNLLQLHYLVSCYITEALDFKEGIPLVQLVEEINSFVFQSCKP